MQEENKNKQGNEEQKQEKQQPHPIKQGFYGNGHYGYYNSGRRRYERRKFHGKRGL